MAFQVMVSAVGDLLLAVVLQASAWGKEFESSVDLKWRVRQILLPTSQVKTVVVALG